ELLDLALVGRDGAPVLFDVLVELGDVDLQLLDLDLGRNLLLDLGLDAVPDRRADARDGDDGDAETREHRQPDECLTAALHCSNLSVLEGPGGAAVGPGPRLKLILALSYSGVTGRDLGFLMKSDDSLLSWPKTPGISDLAIRC